MSEKREGLFNQMFDHKGALSEMAQVAVYLAVIIYVFSYVGCHIFRDTFVRQVAVLLQTIKMCIILAGLLPYLLHSEVSRLYPGVPEDMFPSVMLGLLVFHILVALLFAWIVNKVWNCRDLCGRLSSRSCHNRATAGCSKFSFAPNPRKRNWRNKLFSSKAASCPKEFHSLSCSPPFPKACTDSKSDSYQKSNAANKWFSNIPWAEPSKSRKCYEKSCGDSVCEKPIWSSYKRKPCERKKSPKCCNCYYCRKPWKKKSKRCGRF